MICADDWKEHMNNDYACMDQFMVLYLKKATINFLKITIQIGVKQYLKFLLSLLFLLNRN